MLPITFDVRPPSPTASESSSGESIGSRAFHRPSAVDTIVQAGNRVMASITGGRTREPTRGRSVSRRGRGVLFFLPAIFTPSDSHPIDLGARRNSDARSSSHPIVPAPRFPPEKSSYADDLEDATVFGASSSAQTMPEQFVHRTPSPRRTADPGPRAPPPYPSSGDTAPPTTAWSTEGGWEEWESR